MSSYLYFFGVRGSYPVSGKRYSNYGGNTSCIMVEEEDSYYIFDAGTGITEASHHVLRGEKKNIKIFLSHFHLDHIQGLAFFAPFFIEGYNIDIFGPQYSFNQLERVVISLFTPPLSPIGLKKIKANYTINGLEYKESKVFEAINNRAVSIDYYCEGSHPKSGVLVFAYKKDGKKVVYATDIEREVDKDSLLFNFLYKSDILIHDSQFSSDDYDELISKNKRYGHSSYLMAIKNFKKCKVDKGYFFHYDPSYRDDKLGNLEEKYSSANFIFSKENSKIKV